MTLITLTVCTGHANFVPVFYKGEITVLVFLFELAISKPSYHVLHPKKWWYRSKKL